MLVVALAAMLPVAITLITRPAMYNGIRHFVFVVPPLAVAGGLAVAAIAERLQQQAWRLVLAAALIAGLLVPIVQMVRLHPYEYVHFNLIAGGPAGARGRFMLDYWGLSLKQAGNELRDHLAARGELPPAGRKWRVAVCGPHPSAQVALGESFEPTWDPKGADFALMLAEFYCAGLDAPTIVKIQRAGVTFARAYDLRGLNILGLFTQPPVQPDKPPAPTR